MTARENTDKTECKKGDSPHWKVRIIPDFQVGNP